MVKQDFMVSIVWRLPKRETPGALFKSPKYMQYINLSCKQNVSKIDNKIKDNAKL